MPLSYRRTTRPVRAHNRRKVVWGLSAVTNQSLLTATNATPVDLLAGLRTAGVGLVGGTVVRTHVWLSLVSTAADASPSAVWGIVVWDKSGLGATTANPNTDFYIDWMMHREISPGTSPCSIGLPIGTPTEIAYGNEYDVKARRRLHEMNDTPVFSLFNQGTGTLTYSWFVRTAVMLP